MANGKPGRPKGSGTKSSDKNPITRTLDPEESKDLYKCTRCGKVIKGNPKGKFYLSRHSVIYKGNSDYCGICIDCANALFKTYREKYASERMALILTCCALNLYYDDKLYQSVKDRDLENFGNFASSLNCTQYRNKSFNTFLVDLVEGNLHLKEDEELRDEKETKWRQADRKNKKYVVETVGYDPFDSEDYTDEQRRALFNFCADYIDDSTIEDAHKLQSVIAMTKTMLQRDNIDSLITQEFRKQTPDYQVIKNLTSVKTDLSSDINRIAGDNGISSKFAGKNAKKSTALTAIMKEMSDNGFDDIKVNAIDAKFSESYMEVSALNAKAIQDELNLTGDDYAKMVAEQSEFVRQLQDDNDRLQEELRLTKIALKEEQNKGRSKR